jgi:predicted nuclease of predicted toxin-antitoxin system
MKIKLDENLPLRLAGFLKELSHDVQTVHDERLMGHADHEIWEAAQRESRFLITQEFGFFRFAPVHSGHTSRHPAHTASLAESQKLDRTDRRIVSRRKR